MSKSYCTMNAKSDFLLLWHLKYRFIHLLCIFVENDRNYPKPQQYYSNFLFTCHQMQPIVFNSEHLKTVLITITTIRTKLTILDVTVYC